MYFTHGSSNSGFGFSPGTVRETRKLTFVPALMSLLCATVWFPRPLRRRSISSIP